MHQAVIARAVIAGMGVFESARFLERGAEKMVSSVLDPLPDHGPTDSIIRAERGSGL